MAKITPKRHRSRAMASNDATSFLLASTAVSAAVAADAAVAAVAFVAKETIVYFLLIPISHPIRGGSINFLLPAGKATRRAGSNDARLNKELVALLIAASREAPSSASSSGKLVCLEDIAVGLISR